MAALSLKFINDAVRDVEDIIAGDTALTAWIVTSLLDNFWDS